MNEWMGYRYAFYTLTGYRTTLPLNLMMTFLP